MNNTTKKEIFLPFLILSVTLQNLQPPHFPIGHLLHLVHGLVVEDGLNGLVDDAMAHGEDGLAWVVFRHHPQEAARPVLEHRYGLHVRGPWLVLKVGDVESGETAPIALPQQGSGHRLHAMGMRDDAARVDGALEV